MADNKTTIEVSIEAAEAAKTVQELRKALKDLVNQQANVSAGSAEWKKLTNAINETEGKIGDLQDSFKTLQGSGIERVKSSFGLLKEGFASFDGGKIKAAFSGIGAAMKAIPIFLVIEGIRYLIENFDKLKNSGGLLGKVFTFIGDIIAVVVNHIEELLDAIGLVDKELNDLAEAAEENAKKVTEALAKQTAEYDRQIAVAKANGENTVELEIKKQQAILATNKIIAQQTLELIKQGKVLTEDEVKRAEEAINNIKNANAQIEIIRATETKRIADENKKRADEWKKHKEEIAKINEAEADAWWAARLKEIEDEKAYLAEIQRLKDEAAKQARQAELENQKIDNRDNLARAELQALRNQEDIDAKIALLHTKRDIELQNEELLGSEIKLIKEKYAAEELKLKEAQAEKEKQIEQQKQQAALDAASRTIAATQALTDAYFAFKLAKAKGDDKATLELAKKQFNINKGLQIANATIQGVQAVLAAFSSGSAVPIVGTVLGPVYAALAGVTAAAQIAKISATKFDGGGGGASVSNVSAPTASIPSAPTISTPNNNISGTQFDEQGNTIRPQTAQPTVTVKAQVVESDMTEIQTTVQKYKTQSTF